MITFSPFKRISVENALKHPYLASLHDPSDEPIANSTVDFTNEIKDEDLTKQNVKDGLFTYVVQLNLTHSILIYCLIK